MHKTTVILREMSADEKIREEARRREKRLHDEATALNHARKEGIEEGIEKGRAEGEAIVYAVAPEPSARTFRATLPHFESHLHGR